MKRKARVRKKKPPRRRAADPRIIEELKDRLSDDHLRGLLDGSGIAAEVVAERGYRTVTSKAELRRLGFSDHQCNVPALLMPFHDIDGEIRTYHLRPDQPRIGKNGRPTKYEMPHGSRMTLDVHPLIHQKGWLRDPRRPLFVTEGIKKADSAVSRGLCCVALAGTWCWRGTNEQGGKTALPDWESIALNERNAYIVFDSDVMSKSSVYGALVRLKGFLERRGARVLLVYLPPGEGGEKVGMDDYFIAGHDVADLLALATDELRPPPAGEGDDDTDPYRMTDSGIVWRKLLKDDVRVVPLTNFPAQIVSDIRRDDGVEVQRSFEITAMLGDKKESFELTVPQFAAMNWPAEILGSRAVVHPGYANREHARVAIQMLSDPTERITLAHTGWRRMRNDEWVYLHGAGAVGALGTPPRRGGTEDSTTAREVDLPTSLAPLQLPPTPSDRAARAAVRASLAIVNLAPDRVTFPLLAAVYSAVLGHANFTVFFVGRTGAFKTQLAALAQQHYGSGFDAEHLPASWTSTDNALEDLLFVAKDALVVIDDFVAGGGIDQTLLHAKAERVLRGVGNRSARQRMRSDATLRPPRPPRCLAIVTGEDVPSGHSLRARCLIVEVEPEDVAPERLTECQRQAADGLYAQAMSAYISWLAPRHDELQTEFQEKVAELRDAAEVEPCHRRTSDIVAKLGAGWWFFLEFAKDLGAISRAEDVELWNRGWSALIAAGASQVTFHEDADPTAKFLRLLGSAIQAGRAHLTSLDAERPKNAAMCGWRYREATDWDSPGRWDPQGQHVGWVHRHHLYLNSDAAFAIVQRLAQETGGPFNVKLPTLRKRLNERGYLVSTESAGGKTRLEVRRMILGTRQKVLHLRLADVLGTRTRRVKRKAKNPKARRKKGRTHRLHD